MKMPSLHIQKMCSLILLLMTFSVSSEESQLYSTWRSSCSWRVRIALQLKGIPYDYISLDSVTSDEDYQKLNPLGKVPTLCIDHHVISQSIAILEYLEETRPFPSLLPKDPYERSQVRQIVQMIGSDIQPLQNSAVLKLFPEGESLQWAQHWIHKGLKGVEQMLEETAGIYCVGDEVSMADLFLIPQVGNAHRYEVDLAPFPNICRIEKRLQKHSAFQAAHPEVQPDYFQ